MKERYELDSIRKNFHGRSPLFSLVSSRGRLKAQVKEFMEMRGKLKLVEHVAEGLAQQVSKDISQREQRIRMEYEQKMKRLVNQSTYP